VANDPGEQLFAFSTLLDKSQDIKRILDRTNPYAVDMNDTGDREQIILHRLFETRGDDIDEKAVRDVVSEYVEHYNYPVEIDEVEDAIGRFGQIRGHCTEIEKSKNSIKEELSSIESEVTERLSTITAELNKASD
jgi:hypothetical protein